MKYTHKVQVNQFQPLHQPLHHDFKCHFKVQSLSVLLHNVFCQQTLELLITERAWPVPSPMCTQHPAQVLQSPDMPGPQVHHTIPQLRLVSQAWPTSAKEGRGSVEQRIPAVSRRTVQCSTIRLQYFVTWRITSPCLSSNSSLQNGEHELGHLFRCCRSCKNTSTILLRERAYSATGNSRVHYLKSGYVIQLIAFRWDMAVHQTLSLLLRKCETKLQPPHLLPHLHNMLVISSSAHAHIKT